MKTKLDKKQSTIKDPMIKHYAWAKGIIVKGKKIFHPYTIVKD